MLVQTVAGAASTPAVGPAAPAARIGTVPSAPSGAKALTSPPPTTALNVDVVLQPRDPAALTQFATEVSTPGSALYRHYLAPGQFPSVFGPTDATIAAVETALRAEGLQPGTISADHLSIPVAATTGQLSHAFSIGFQRYQLAGGRVAYANTAAPLIPGSAAGLVQGVVGLDDLQVPQPLGLLPSPQAPTTASTPQVVTGGPQPCTAAIDAAPPWHAYTADQLASAYRFSSLYGAGDLGAGQTVALYELAPNLTSDINAYQLCYGTSASVSYVTVDSGAGAESDNSVEPVLDIEEIIGLAPRANIVVYQGPDTGTGAWDTVNKIVSQDVAKVISISWGLCELAGYGAYYDEENILFQEAAAQGQSIFASAGDTGSEDCLEESESDTALAVDDPASQPYVTGVGGTTLSALGPPPTETVWNAGGGGISMSWPMPSYQSSAPASLHVINANSSGLPCGAPTGKYCREVPDVSADADPYTGYLIYYTGTGTYGDEWQGIGGTSAAAPQWAALMALINADSACAGTPIGFANPALYTVAGSSSYSSALHDITVGNNDYRGTNRGLYPAETGFDMASGLGTPNAGVLAGLLCALRSALPPSVTTSTASSVTASGATLNGTVNPNAYATTYQFQYGTSTSYGTTTTSTGAGSGISAVAATAVLAGLSPSTIYDFRLVATNANGTTDGSKGTFTTPAAPLPVVSGLSPATGPVAGGTAVTITGANFTGATVVDFGTTAATSLAVVSSTSITATSPAELAGTANVTVTTSSGTSVMSLAGQFSYWSTTGSVYTALLPFRLLDTRSSGPALGPGQTRTLQVTSVTGPQSQSVPSTAQSVVLNVTAISGTAGTYLTVYPTGSSLPTASNLNVPAQTNQANLVVVALGTGGEVSIYNSLGSINVAVDVEGYFAAPGSGSTTPGLFHPISPLRICDTRSGADTACSGSALGAGEWTKVVVSGCPTGDPSCTASVPTDATTAAVALNLTAVSGTQGTYLSVVPPNSGDSCPTGAPSFSNLNVNAQTNLPNRVIVPVGPDQDVCVYNSLGTINFILDVSGWFGDGIETSQGAYYYAIGPTRICDTRSAASVGYSTECSGDPLSPGGTLTIPVAGADGLPSAGGTTPPVAVIANVTAVSGTSFTYFTLYPADVALPIASDLNVGAYQNSPNLVIVQLATTGSNAGTVDLFNDLGAIDAIVDVAGWFQT
jgi:hypothetical protein